MIPIVPIFVGYAFIWMTGLGTFGLSEEFHGREIELVIGFFITIIFIGLTVTLGEEIGWRGYLAAKLEQLGLAKALLLNGFICGLFHLPVIIFTEIYHAGVNLLIYVPMFMITITLAGAFIDLP